MKKKQVQINNYKWVNPVTNELINSIDIKLGFGFLNGTNENSNTVITGYRFKLVDLNNNEVTNYSEDFTLTGDISKYMEVYAYGNNSYEADLYIIMNRRNTFNPTDSTISYNINTCYLQYKDNSTNLPLNIEIIREFIPLLLVSLKADENTIFASCTYLTANGVNRTINSELWLVDTVYENGSVGNVVIFSEVDLVYLKSILPNNTYIYLLLGYFNSNISSLYETPINLLSLSINNGTSNGETKKLKELQLLLNYYVDTTGGSNNKVYYKVYYIE